ncbi:MAG: hypothetical protein M3298_03870 [Thermoproteota archaeon]|nr:hypothetical protein [Thermoproteota archaeon]MDQ3807286.1 hypothetical protein [Thermoproteota archaeon]MDQ5843487.1 hypothetical protein [Thermoproteota archaeon]
MEKREEESGRIPHHEKIITSYSLVTLCVPIVALVFVLAYGNLLALNYLHVLTGGTWTGIDLFMGIVMGRILKGLEPPARTQVIKKLVPLMLFLVPALATVAITSGINLASKIGILTFASPMIIAAVVIVVILSVQGFGIIMPTEIRVFLELRKKEPNRDKIIRWGMRNVKLAGSQGVFQVALIFVMANLALGYTLIPQ